MSPPLAPDLTRAVLEFLGVAPGPATGDLLHALATAYPTRVPWESASRIARRAVTPDRAACPRWPEAF